MKNRFIDSLGTNPPMNKLTKTVIGKLVASAIVLMAVLAIVTMSCNEKSQTPEPTKFNIGTVSKSNLDFAMDDLIGAVFGMSYGSIAGPFGAFCGGVSFGCYMSVRDLRVIPSNPPVNPTDDVGGNVYVLSANNPYEFIGNIHNKAVQYIFENPGIFYLPDETFDTSAYVNWAPSFYGSFPELSGFSLNPTTFQMWITDIDSFYAGNFSSALTHLQLESVISLEVNNSLDYFWSSMLSLPNNNDRKTFYINYVDDINNSPTLTSDEKTILLGSSALGIFSILYHSANTP